MKCPTNKSCQVHINMSDTKDLCTGQSLHTSQFFTICSSGEYLLWDNRYEIVLLLAFLHIEIFAKEHIMEGYKVYIEIDFLLLHIWGHALIASCDRLVLAYVPNFKAQTITITNLRWNFTNCRKLIFGYVTNVLFFM